MVCNLTLRVVEIHLLTALTSLAGLVPSSAHSRPWLMSSWAAARFVTVDLARRRFSPIERGFCAGGPAGSPLITSSRFCGLGRRYRSQCYDTVLVGWSPVGLDMLYGTDDRRGRHRQRQPCAPPSLGRLQKQGRMGAGARRIIQSRQVEMNLGTVEVTRGEKMDD